MTLLMDIVTMKLPVNALIFLTAIRVEFNVNFLNRCRVNTLSGEQVSKLVASVIVSSCCRGNSANLNCSNWKLPRVLAVSSETQHGSWLIA